jgi:WhiB family transcriptional regulator, redox-sensing transcriptional regulator
MDRARSFSWLDDARCAGEDESIFFPDRYDGGYSQLAFQICAACPVRAECLEFAMVNRIGWGVFGGLTAAQRFPNRRELRAARGSNWEVTPKHGTEAGYTRHRRNGEDACDACLSALRVKSRDRARARRAAGRVAVPSAKAG